MPERPRKDGRPRAFSMSLGRVDPLDVQKAEKKGRTIGKALEPVVASDATLEASSRTRRA